ncbi:substrate-binding periplasmic protein [Agarivorans sp. QJM3NY_25]|uniref:substrate-binding periplasmic protein n=1 Tax=Agarivorans sp. QJM3NY_25 TaxID=3421430 RepID=UPI003D7DABEE
MKALVIVFLFICFPLMAGSTMRISAAAGANALPEVLDMISSAYAIMGYKIELLGMPAKRALRQARDNPNIDAELARSQLVENYLTNYIRIPVPVKTLVVSAFVVDDSIHVSQWQQLTPYRVGLVRGHLAFHEQLKNHPAVEYFTSANQAITMLERGRVDVVILPKQIGEYAIKKYWHKQTRAVTPPIDQIYLYHYLNQKHQAIASELTHILQQLTIQSE